jgi:Gpi18-like mannosyltransferase
MLRIEARGKVCNVDRSIAPGGGITKRPLRPVLLVLFALAIYAFLWPGVTGDMRHFLLPWLDHILERGPVGAFAAPFSNYTPPYLYLLALVSPLAAFVPKISLIKALSVAGTVCLAAAFRQLLRSAGKSEFEAALWLLILPSVAINAAGFGQCDAAWSAACLMAIAAAASGRRLAMVMWFGIAISFKAQAAFLGPFVVLQLVQQRARPVLWGVPALVYGLAMLPAAVAGWPLANLATVYLRQAEWNPELASTASNPWSVVQYLTPGSASGWFWTGFLAAAVAALVYVAAFRRRELDATGIVALALLSACLVPFLLPKMHERFFFLADVLAFALALLRQDRRSAVIFCLVEGASVLAYAGVMVKMPLLPVIGAPIMLAAILLLIDYLQPNGKAEAADGGPVPLGQWESRAAPARTAAS